MFDNLHLGDDRVPAYLLLLPPQPVYGRRRSNVFEARIEVCLEPFER
jgi:hypothetical protein